LFVPKITDNRSDLLELLEKVITWVFDSQCIYFYYRLQCK